MAQAIRQRITEPEDSNSIRSLRRNMSWTVAGNVIYAAAQWAVLAVIAKLGTPADVGRFALGLAITAPLVLFANLQLRGVQATDAKQEFRFGDYMSLRLSSTTVAFLAITGIALLGEYDRPSAAVILFVGLAKAFDAMSDILYGFFQQHERLDLAAQALVFNGGISLIGVTMGMWLTSDLRAGAAGWMLGSLLTLVPVNVALTHRVRSSLAISEVTQGAWLQWDHVALLRLVRLALPLGTVMLIISLNTNVPRLVIERSLGAEELGVFAAVAYLIIAGGVVMTAVGQAASPRLARYFASGDRTAYLQLLGRMVAGAALVGAAAVVLMPLLGQSALQILYTDEFTTSTEVLATLGLAAGVGWVASMLGYAMTAARRFTVQLPLFAGVLVVATAASMLLIPTVGMLGAAMVLVISAVTQLVGSGLVVRRALRMGHDHAR